MYICVVRGWNCAKTIDRCLHSILNQAGDFRVTVILDPSDDDSVAKALQYRCDRVFVHVNDRKLGPTANTYYGVAMSSPEIKDIICMVDSDDWLYPDALKTLGKYYDEDTLLTYGSFILDCSGKKSRICKPYKKGTDVRTSKWRATHLRTFRAELFRKLPVNYLTHKERWIPAASDLATMIPMIELAGLGNCKFVKEPIYHYNNKTDYSIKRGLQRKWERIIRAKKPLRRVF